MATITPRPPNIKRYNATFECISMASHPPEIRPAQSYMFDNPSSKSQTYDLRVTSGDLVSLMGALRYFLGKHLRPPPLKTTLSEWSLCRNKYPL